MRRRGRGIQQQYAISARLSHSQARCPPSAKDHRHLVAGALDYSMCHACEGVEYDPMNMSVDYHLATGRARDYLSNCKSIAELNVIHALKA